MEETQEILKQQKKMRAKERKIMFDLARASQRIHPNSRVESGEVKKGRKKNIRHRAAHEIYINFVC